MRRLFASNLQPSDAPAAGTVASAINGNLRQHGIGGCVGRMAQEFGDHPDAAAKRMRWARRLTAAGRAATRNQLGADGGVDWFVD